MKTDPVTTAHTLVGKDNDDGYYFYTEYAVRLLPSGLLRVLMEDGNRTVWKAELQPTTYKVDDNQWHYVAMVVDRTANRMSLYVDGSERASSLAPTGFGAQLNAGQQLRAGHYAYYDGWGGQYEFPGTLDEIRVSSTAHSAAAIQKMYLGTEGSLGIVLTSNPLVTLARGQTTEIQLTGYNLAGINATVNSSTPDQMTAQVTASAPTQASVQVDGWLDRRARRRVTRRLFKRRHGYDHLESRRLE